VTICQYCSREFVSDGRPVALSRADYVVTESGFGADIGFEKFCHIKSRVLGVTPDAVVLVCTIRALKAHSGRYKIVAGKPLDPQLLAANPADVNAWCSNLRAQIANAAAFGGGGGLRSLP
jgi:formate--tetrahydrofolate ligase